METLTAVIENRRYASEESGWAVLSVRVVPGDQPETVVGPFAHFQPGDELEFTGQWVNDRKWGRQFKGESAEARTPATVVGIRRFLERVQGVGEKTAAKLVDRFGLDTLDVIWDDPARLREVPGLGEERAAKIHKVVSARRAEAAAAVELRSVGLPHHLVARVVARYGQHAVRVAREEPYRMVHEVRGVGFRIADHVAITAGFPLAGAERIRAGLAHCLDEAADDEGHCYLPRAQLMQRAARLLGLTRETIEPELVELEGEGHVVMDGEAIYLSLYHQCECLVAHRLRSIAATPDGREAPLPSVEADDAGGVELTAEQLRALDAARENKVFILTGGPGTGKTTITRAFLGCCRRAGLEVALAAPTGRAAKRLSEATGAHASTIHRLLEYHPEVGWRRNRLAPLEQDLVLVDEVSMVDLVLMSRLLEAVRDEARLVLVGDADQLPSVGAGRVLADMLAADLLPAVELQQIHRQAAQSRIVTGAHAVNRGILPELDPPPDGETTDLYFVDRQEAAELVGLVVRLVSRYLPERFGLAAEDIWVLTPQNVGPLGTKALNPSLQAVLNPDGRPVPFSKRGFRVGDRVMQQRNDYDLLVFNGDAGVVTGYDEEEETVDVQVDDRVVTYDRSKLRNLQLAYACTVHKSQGSEYPCVVLVMHQSHFIMLKRPLLYTGMTRARRLLVLAGQRQAVGIACRQEVRDARHSGLAWRLDAAEARPPAEGPDPLASIGT